MAKRTRDLLSNHCSQLETKWYQVQRDHPVTDGWESQEGSPSCIQARRRPATGFWYCLLLKRNKRSSILCGMHQQTHLRQIITCPHCTTISRNYKSEKSLFQNISFALQLVQHMQASCTLIPLPWNFQSLLVIWVGSRGKKGGGQDKALGSF